NPILEGTLIEGQEEWGETQYIEFMTEIFLENEHLDKAKVYIDKENKTPIGAIIYDKQGNDRVRILYKDFKKMKSDEMIIE
ncbi:MAG: germination lipoprotein GerS-related protein, partial [Clostridium sp.]